MAIYPCHVQKMEYIKTRNIGFRDAPVRFETGRVFCQKLSKTHEMSVMAHHKTFKKSSNSRDSTCHASFFF